jgi:hypothetical protein
LESAAHRAFYKGEWYVSLSCFHVSFHQYLIVRSRLTGSDRAVKLRQIADAITARKAKLAELEVCSKEKDIIVVYYTCG